MRTKEGTRRGFNFPYTLISSGRCAFAFPLMLPQLRCWELGFVFPQTSPLQHHFASQHSSSGVYRHSIFSRIYDFNMDAETAWSYTLRVARARDQFQRRMTTERQQKLKAKELNCASELIFFCTRRLPNIHEDRLTTSSDPTSK